MKVAVEAIGVDLKGLARGTSRDLELVDGASVADASSAFGVEPGAGMLAMVNGESVPPGEWGTLALKEADRLSFFRPFKGG